MTSRVKITSERRLQCGSSCTVAEMRLLIEGLPSGAEVHISQWTGDQREGTSTTLRVDVPPALPNYMDR
jgi:hypothetical protein